MLYRYPPNTIAVAVCDYDAPYPDPIAVRGGDVVVPDEVRTRETDFVGWTWCRGPDGREGWVPDAWLERGPADVRLKRDFDARELSVRTGERVAGELLSQRAGR